MSDEPLPTPSGGARPPRYDAANARAYVDHMVAVVGDRDPLALLEAAPGRLRAACEGLSDADARRPPAEGAWSVMQVVRHLADSEIVYGYRLRLIVADDRPAIPGYDQDAWSRTLGYHEGTLAEALEDVAAQRRMTMRWLRALPADAWERAGLHNERGPESVRQISVLLAAHDLAHEGQIRRARASVGR